VLLVHPKRHHAAGGGRCLSPADKLYTKRTELPSMHSVAVCLMRGSRRSRSIGIYNFRTASLRVTCACGRLL
jgi:hypothetical protein